MKQCKDCHKIKEEVDFYGFQGECKECTKKRTAAYAKINGTDLKRYRGNLKRLFSHKYSMMKQRVLGKSRKGYTVTGKRMLSKENFLLWCFSEKSMTKFIPIYEKWKESGYKKIISPSIDRIDNSKGYVLGNLQWLTHSENSAKSRTK